MKNSKNEQDKNSSSGHGGSSHQHKGSSQQHKEGKQKHASGAGRNSSTGADSDDDMERNNEINDDPEGTRKKIPQMKK
jgi:hypothetical protein